MNQNAKLKLWVTTVTAACASLSIGTIYLVFFEMEARRTKMIEECSTTGDSGMHFDLIEQCIKSIWSLDLLPLWLFILPLIPGFFIIWLSWVFFNDLRLPEEHYPRKTIATLKIFAALLVVAVIVGFTYTASHSVITSVIERPKNPWETALLAIALFSSVVLFERTLRKTEHINYKFATRGLILLGLLTPLIWNVITTIKVNNFAAQSSNKSHEILRK
jgi:hypothetical protein